MNKDILFWQKLEQHKNEKLLIYVDRRSGKRSTETLSQEARRRGFAATHFHAGLSTEARAEIIRQYKANEITAVFATSAFGMGIDIPDIRGVVHYLLPESIEQYYQQVGRVGRDGKPAWATLFYSDKNISVRKMHYIEKSFPNSELIQKAFESLTRNQVGKKTFVYFDEGDTQSAYHYLLRSKVIDYVCKGIQNLSVFEAAPNINLPKFDYYQQATRRGLLISTAKKTKQSEGEIVEDLYGWLAQRKIRAKSSPSKCLVINARYDALPDTMLDQILADVQEKKTYRYAVFEEFVDLLNSYENSGQLHHAIGTYLGLGKFVFGRIHETLSGIMVRSKSEVIIANILFERGIKFKYEQLLKAGGKVFSPDFTIESNNATYFWEHLGMLDHKDYRRHWDKKKIWYQQHFPGQLLTTEESQTLSKEAETLINKYFSTSLPLQDTGPTVSHTLPERIAQVEVRLRDFIDHRLTSLVGANYWDQVVNKRIVKSAQRGISDYLSRHPYEDETQFDAGRQKLNYCNVSDYENLIKDNWVHFEEIFKRQDQFEAHMTNYRRLRNTEAHNRQASEVEEPLGSTAVTWLERILDKYEQGMQ